MTTSEQTVGVFTVDKKLVISSWDGWLARLSAIPAEAARGKSLAELFPDLQTRGLLARIERVLAEGVVEVLAPTFHHYLIPCVPSTPSMRFDKMQQRVTIAPLLEGDRVIGALVTIDDVTARLDRERDLAEQLASADETTRLRAAEALAQQSTIESAQPLLGAIGDQSWRVRRAAVDGLTRQAGHEAVKSLLRTLRDEHRNPNVLNSALQVLASSGVDVFASLVEFLSDPDPDLRTYVTLALGEQRDERATPALVALLEDPDANVRYHAIEALSRLRAVEAVDKLAAIAESRDFFLAFPALDALTNIGDSRIAPRLVPLVEDDILQAPAVEALAQLGDEEVCAPLTALLNRPGARAGVIAGALATLYDRYENLYQEGADIIDIVRREISDLGARNLLDALSDANAQELRALVLVLGWLEGEEIERALTRLLGSPGARKEVIEALVRHGARVIDLLVEQLQSEDLETRQAAVIALGQIGDPRSVPALLRVLSEDEELVIIVAGALAKIGDRRAFDPLVVMLGHPNAAVRQAVIAALNSLGHPEMAARALTLMADENPNVRESAVRIAGYFGYAECQELLLERCHDPVEGVRRAAVEHIPYLDNSNALRTLASALANDTPGVRAAAARAFAHIDVTQALPHLLEALKDTDIWVRYYAARSIGQHAFPEATDALARLANTDEANPVRIAAMEALGRIGGARAVVVLASLTGSDNADLARAAINGLGLIDHPDALGPLVACTRSQELAHRIAAIEALGNRRGEDAAGELQWIAATDANSLIAQEAIGALAQIATPKAIDAIIALAAEPSRHQACVAALARLGEREFELIGRGLSHAQAGVRRAVIEALERAKRTRAGTLERGTR